MSTVVTRFLRWVRTAPVTDRAEAAAALARAYLWSEMRQAEREAAAAAMTLLLDDPSPMVRGALAGGLAADPRAPRHLVLALAQDVPEAALPILAHSPVLGDLDLVDLVASHSDAGQSAIAEREEVPPTVAAALVEVGTAAACAVLVRNPGATLTDGIIARLVARHGTDPDVRSALMDHADLPAALRQVLLLKLSNALTRFVVGRDWLPRERAQAAAREACERATLAIAAEPDTAMAPLVHHLKESGQLTTALLLRGALSGNLDFVCTALAELAGVPARHVSALVANGAEGALGAILSRAGLPVRSHSVFRVALALLREDGGLALPADRLRFDLVEEVLAAHLEARPESLDPLLAMLRRFAAEAEREAALDIAIRLAEPEIERNAA